MGIIHQSLPSVQQGLPIHYLGIFSVNFFSRLFVYLAFVSSSASASQARDIGGEYVRLFSSGEFEAATQLLFCPPSMNKDAVDADRQSITQTLKIFADELPEAESWKLAENNLYVSATTACGTTGYWKAHPPNSQIVYETRDSQGNRGYIILSFSVINGAPALAFVSHGLPASVSSTALVTRLLARIASK